MNFFIFGKFFLEGGQFILLHGVGDGFALLVVDGIPLLLRPIVQLPAQDQRSNQEFFLFGGRVEAKLVRDLHEGSPP
jgi:hypothetical protein